MAPALARRTPQLSQNEGRPKRQAAMNHKETPGAPKKKGDSSTASKTEASASKKKVESSTSKVTSPKKKVESSTSNVTSPMKKGASTSKKETPAKKKVEPSAASKVKAPTKAKEKQPAKKASTRKAATKKKIEPQKKTKAAAAGSQSSGNESENRRKSARGKQKKEKEEEVDEDAKSEEVEEENPNEVKLAENETKENSTEDSQDEGETEEEEESDPDDGELDDDDEDFDPDDDPDKLWCFCKKPHGNRFMICCDTCEDWFHGDCVGVSMSKGREMEKTGEEWCCNKCKEKLKTSQKLPEDLPSKSPLNSPLRKTSEKTIDLNVITKARSLSLDSMKSNFAKLKDRKLSLSDSTKKPPKDVDDSSKEILQKEESLDSKNDETRTKDEINTLSKEDEKTTPNKTKADKTKPEKVKIEIPGFTFDHVPVIKKDDKLVRKRSSDRRDSIEESEELKKKRRDSAAAKVKVRTTPTPKQVEPIKACKREECSRPVARNSIYCSRECIYKYATESIKFIEEKKKSVSTITSPDPKTTSHGTTIISPATSSTDRVMETTQERIAVFEKSSGKIVAGVMAPTKKYLFAWLEEHPTYEVLQRGKQSADVKSFKKDQDEVVRNNVRKSLRDILVSRCKATLMAINLEAVGKICKKIEGELLRLFGETGQKYKTKYRSLIFNLKDQQNKILYKRVVSGEITPSQLVHMSPEQLATPELARWREQESKHHIELVKKREKEAAELSKHTGLKKTHKGEVEIDTDNANLETLEIRAEPTIERRRSSSVSSEILLKDTTDEHSHHLFDLNCHICTGKMVPPGESQVTGVSTTVLQVVPESSVPSPDYNSAVMRDDDPLMRDDDSTIMSSPPSPDTSALSPSSPTITPIQPPSVRKQPSVWRGFVMMQKVSKFVCTAYAVSGTCENLMETLPDTIHVCGRIPPSQVWDYLSQMKEGRKNQNKFIDVIRFEMSSNEEKAGYIKLYTYFYTRQRVGVVGNCYSGVKDMYILPLASHDPIPPELKPLPGLPKPRPHMLLGIIVRVKATKKKRPTEAASLDSSPDMIPKKKKKKKDRKLKDKEFDKERVEVEAQKKLLDIIFKNRTNDSSNENDQSTSSIIKNIDPAAILKTLENKEKERNPESTTKDDSDIDFHQVTDKHKQLEVEQLQKLQEQQEEINRLQKEIETPNKESETSTQHQSSSEIIIPDPGSIIETIKDVINIPDPESIVKGITDSKPSPNIDGDDDIAEKQEDIELKAVESSISPESISAQIDTEINTSSQSDVVVSSQAIPFMDSVHENTVPIVTPEKQTDPRVRGKNITVPKPLPMDGEQTDPRVRGKNIAVPKPLPMDEEFVMNLIDDIKISTFAPKFPLDIIKKRQDNKMPELPAIKLPIAANFKLPPPGTIPKVPFPPNIKLPPGVPFPPLPPKPLHIPRSSLPVNQIPDTPQSPPDSMRGDQTPIDPRRNWDNERSVEPPNIDRSYTRDYNHGNPSSQEPRMRPQSYDHALRSQDENSRIRPINPQDYHHNDPHEDRRVISPIERANKNRYQDSGHIDRQQPALSWRNQQDPLRPGEHDRFNSNDNQRYVDNSNSRDSYISSQRPPERNDAFNNFQRSTQQQPAFPGPPPRPPRFQDPPNIPDRFSPPTNFQRPGPRFPAPTSSGSMNHRPPNQLLNQPGVRPFLGKPPFNMEQPPFNMERPPFNMEQMPFNMKLPPFNMERPPFNMNKHPFNIERPPFNINRPPFNIERPPINKEQSLRHMQQPQMNMPRPMVQPQMNTQRPPFEKKGVPFHPLGMNVHQGMVKQQQGPLNTLTQPGLLNTPQPGLLNTLKSASQSTPQQGLLNTPQTQAMLNALQPVNVQSTPSSIQASFQPQIHSSEFLKTSADQVAVSSQAYKSPDQITLHTPNQPNKIPSLLDGIKDFDKSVPASEPKKKHSDQDYDSRNDANESKKRHPDQGYDRRSDDSKRKHSDQSYDRRSDDSKRKYEQDYDNKRYSGHGYDSRNDLNDSKKKYSNQGYDRRNDDSKRKREQDYDSRNDLNDSKRKHTDQSNDKRKDSIDSKRKHTDQSYEKRNDTNDSKSKQSDQDNARRDRRKIEQDLNRQKKDPVHEETVVVIKKDTGHVRDDHQKDSFEDYLRKQLSSNDEGNKEKDEKDINVESKKDRFGRDVSRRKELLEEMHRDDYRKLSEDLEDGEVRDHENSISDSQKCKSQKHEPTVTSEPQIISKTPPAKGENFHSDEFSADEQDAWQEKGNYTPWGK